MAPMRASDCLTPASPVWRPSISETGWPWGGDIAHRYVPRSWNASLRDEEPLTPAAVCAGAPARPSGLPPPRVGRANVRREAVLFSGPKQAHL